MSPTPPPLRSPWFMTVTMHMSRVSQARSVLSSSSSSASRACAQPRARPPASAPTAPDSQDALPSPARTSGTTTPETQSMLSPLQVSTNVAAPCGIPRGLAGGDRIKEVQGLSSSSPQFWAQHHILQEACPDPTSSPLPGYSERSPCTCPRRAVLQGPGGGSAPLALAHRQLPQVPSLT